jgi:hypothetical protein
LAYNAVGDEPLVFENLEERAKEVSAPFVARLYQELIGQPVESIIDTFLDA